MYVDQSLQNLWSFGLTNSNLSLCIKLPMKKPEFRFLSETLEMIEKSNILKQSSTLRERQADTHTHNGEITTLSDSNMLRVLALSETSDQLRR